MCSHLQVPGKVTIRLLSLMEDNSQDHQVLTNVVMNAAMEAAEQALLKVLNCHAVYAIRVVYI